MAKVLCYSEYGNYIIQHILKGGLDKEVIVDIIMDNLEQLSLNKYGSNTVEKLIEQASRAQLKQVSTILLRKQNEQ